MLRNKGGLLQGIPLIVFSSQRKFGGFFGQSRIRGNVNVQKPPRLRRLFSGVKPVVMRILWETIPETDEGKGYHLKMSLRRSPGTPLRLDPPRNPPPPEARNPPPPGTVTRCPPSDPKWFGWINPKPTVTRCPPSDPKWFGWINPKPTVTRCPPSDPKWFGWINPKPTVTRFWDLFTQITWDRTADTS